MQEHHESGTEHVSEMYGQLASKLEEDTVIKDTNEVCITSFIFDSIQLDKLPVTLTSIEQVLVTQVQVQIWNYSV